MASGLWAFRRPAVKKGDILVTIGRNIMGEALPDIEVAKKTSEEKRSKKLYWSEVIHPIPLVTNRVDLA